MTRADFIWVTASEQFRNESEFDHIDWASSTRLRLTVCRSWSFMYRWIDSIGFSWLNVLNSTWTNQWGLREKDQLGVLNAAHDGKKWKVKAIDTNCQHWKRKNSMKKRKKRCFAGKTWISLLVVVHVVGFIWTLVRRPFSTIQSSFDSSFLPLSGTALESLGPIVFVELKRMKWENSCRKCLDNWSVRDNFDLFFPCKPDSNRMCLRRFCRAELPLSFGVLFKIEPNPISWKNAVFRQTWRKRHLREHRHPSKWMFPHFFVRITT